MLFSLARSRCVAFDWKAWKWKKGNFVWRKENRKIFIFHRNFIEKQRVMLLFLLYSLIVNNFCGLTQWWSVELKSVIDRARAAFVSSLFLELMTFNHSSKGSQFGFFCDLWHRLSAARLFDLQPRVLSVSDLFTFPDCHQNSRESCRAQEFNDLSRVYQTTLRAHLQQPQNIHYDLNNLFLSSAVLR